MVFNPMVAVWKSDRTGAATVGGVPGVLIDDGAVSWCIVVCELTGNSGTGRKPEAKARPSIATSASFTKPLIVRVLARSD